MPKEDNDYFPINIHNNIRDVKIEPFQYKFKLGAKSYNLTHNNYGDKILSESLRGTVIALDKTLVAKINSRNVDRSLKEEAELLIFCNKVNDLLVKFKDYKEDAKGNCILIMERVYPLQYRSIEIGERKKFFADFKLKLEELHSSGFAYVDFFLTRTADLNKTEADVANYMLTRKGIRLIDVGMSILKDEPPSFISFEKAVQKDISDLKYLYSIICRV